VIGGGIGGLTAAALLAHEGRSVLLVERAEGAGGCVHSFRRGQYRLDPAVHLVVDPSHTGRLLEHLGVGDEVQFVEVPHFYSAVGPGFQITVPFGAGAFVDAHVAQFGEDARRFLEGCIDLHERLHELPPTVTLAELEGVLREDPSLFRLLRATLAEAMEELALRGNARVALGLPGLYLGLAPSQLSFRTYAQMLLAHVTHRAALVEGGLQRVVDALTGSIDRDGGEVVLGRDVTRIIADDGRVSGIRLDDDRVVNAQAVVSNADPLQTFERLVGFDALPAQYVRRLGRLSVSHSIFSLFTATTMDLARFEHASHLMFVTAESDLERAFTDGLEGRPPYATLCIPTLSEAEAAPEGEHLIMATAVAAYDPARPWPELRDRSGEALLAVLEDAFPGLGTTLTFTETATPVAIERHTGNSRGATYAWGNSPTGTGSRLPDNKTPIDGLFLAGAWTAPGSGFARAMSSGHRAAQHVLDAAGDRIKLPRFMS
jgi:phytoene dehydrogenase-like protein